MLTIIQNFIGQPVELLIGGHFMSGTIENVDVENNTFTLLEEAGTSPNNNDVWTVSVDSVDMIKGG